MELIKWLSPFLEIYVYLYNLSSNYVANSSNIAAARLIAHGDFKSLLIVCV